MKNRVLSLIVAMALLAPVCATRAMAQETTATITGQVIDAAGDAVSGADITITNVSTREERKTRSGEDGYYSLPSIPPGVYDVSVKVQGFKEYVNKSVEMSVNDR